MKYKVSVLSTESGTLVWVPCLPGCRAWGRTEEEALGNIKRAIRAYLEALEEQNAGLDQRTVEVL